MDMSKKGWCRTLVAAQWYGIPEKVLGKDPPRTKATFAAIFKIETNNANLDPTFFYTSEEQLRLISESDSSPWDGLEE